MRSPFVSDLDAGVVVGPVPVEGHLVGEVPPAVALLTAVVRCEAVAAKDDQALRKSFDIKLLATKPVKYRSTNE